MINKILENFDIDENLIYISKIVNNNIQLEEKKLRLEVASKTIENYLSVIEKSHSIPVMDYEVKNFIKKVKFNGVILDIGGCWGWHWRNLYKIRPDIKVVIIDFIKENLIHAKKLLSEKIGKTIFLVHGDATSLDFKDECFDAIWTVQTLQHIPNFEGASKEAYRVLKRGGIFSNYSLNIQPHIALVKKLFNKKYIIKGKISGVFWLERASKSQKNILERIFNSKVKERWSEIIYSPELRFYLPGRENNIIGKLDAKISNNHKLFHWFARQCSFHCKKNY